MDFFCKLFIFNQLYIHFDFFLFFVSVMATFFSLFVVYFISLYPKNKKCLNFYHSCKSFLNFRRSSRKFFFFAWNIAHIPANTPEILRLFLLGLESIEKALKKHSKRSPHCQCCDAASVISLSRIYSANFTGLMPCIMMRGSR